MPKWILNQYLPTYVGNLQLCRFTGNNNNIIDMLESLLVIDYGYKLNDKE